MNGLNTNSYITLGLGITIISASIGGAFWLSSQFSGLRQGQELTQERMSNLKEKLELRLSTLETAKVADRWSGTDMFKWAVKLQRENPAIKVPEPKHEE